VQSIFDPSQNVRSKTLRPAAQPADPRLTSENLVVERCFGRAKEGGRPGHSTWARQIRALSARLSERLVRRIAWHRVLCSVNYAGFARGELSARGSSSLASGGELRLQDREHAGAVHLPESGLARLGVELARLLHEIRALRLRWRGPAPVPGPCARDRRRTRGCSPCFTSAASLRSRMKLVPARLAEHIAHHLARDARVGRPGPSLRRGPPGWSRDTRLFKSFSVLPRPTSPR